MKSGMVYNIQRMSTKDGPGLRTTIFLKGCPLSCPWCSNPESQSFQPQLLVFSNLCRGCGACASVCPHGAVVETDDKFNRDLALCKNCGACVKTCLSNARVMAGKRMTVQEVMSVVDCDSLFYANSEGGVTFGGGEPTAAGDFLIALLENSRAKGYHTCLDTCGACSSDQFRKVMALTDLFLFDCKHMDPQEHRRLTGMDNRIILENLRLALEAGKAVRIRVPLMPGINDTEENIVAMAHMLHAYGKDDVDVLPCHAFGGSKYSALRLPQPAMTAYQPEALNSVLELFARYGLKVTLI